MIHVLEKLFPVFALIGAGYALRRCTVTTAEFLSVSDRTELASAAIVVSTLLSVFSLSAALLM